MGEPIVIWPQCGGGEGDPCQFEYPGSGLWSCPEDIQEQIQEEYGAGAWACCPL